MICLLGFIIPFNSDLLLTGPNLDLSTGVCLFTLNMACCQFYKVCDLRFFQSFFFFLTWAVCDYLCCRIQDNFTFTIQKIYIHNRWFNTSALSVSLSVKTKFDTVPDSLSPYGLFYAIILCLLKISYLSAFFDDLDYVWEELWFVAQTMHLLHLKPKQKS